MTTKLKRVTDDSKKIKGVTALVGQVEAGANVTVVKENGVFTISASGEFISSVVSDTNITGAVANNVLTLAWAGLLAPSRGGTGISSLGTGIASALGVNVGSAGAPVLFNGAGGTPSSLTLTNATGLPIGTRHQEWTSSGTFTVPVGTIAATVFKFTLVAAGGGGAHGAAGNVSEGGGGGGETVIKYLSGLTAGNTITVTIGAGGTANGGNGGNTTLTSGTQSITTVTANGGSGISASLAGGAGGTGGTGDINIKGQQGGNGTVAGTYSGGGYGGASGMGMGAGGRGGISADGTAANGIAGQVYGGGGGGGGAGLANAGTGAAGAAGFARVEWVL